MHQIYNKYIYSTEIQYNIYYIYCLIYEKYNEYGIQLNSNTIFIKYMTLCIKKKINMDI